MEKKGVVLVSGGLDSATTLAMAREAGFAPYALSFRYGQRHEVELTSAQRVCESLGVVAHQIVNLDLRPFGGSALTSDLPVPKGTQVGGNGGRDSFHLRSRSEYDLPSPSRWRMPKSWELRTCSWA
jgi:7-cyano-7-deazaguanine synthase